MAVRLIGRRRTRILRPWRANLKHGNLCAPVVETCYARNDDSRVPKPTPAVLWSEANFVPLATTTRSPGRLGDRDLGALVAVPVTKLADCLDEGRTLGVILEFLP